MKPESMQKVPHGMTMTKTHHHHMVRARSCWTILRTKNRQESLALKTVTAMRTVIATCSLRTWIGSWMTPDSRAAVPGFDLASGKRFGAFKWIITTAAIRLAVAKKRSPSSMKRRPSLCILMKVWMAARKTASPSSIQITICHPIIRFSL